MENDQGQGSFKLLKSFLGTIAGGLSSLASLPFGKRKKPEDSLLDDASPHSPAGLEQSGDDLSRLYPDMELSETRKRARLSLDEVFEDTIGYKNDEGKYFDGKGLEESSEICLCETSVGLERGSIQLDDVQYAPDKMLQDFDVTAFSSEGVSHVSHGEIGIQHNTNVSVDLSGHDKALPDVGEDSDDFLSSFRSSLMVARKTKEQKRAQNPLMEESPRKKVRFGESTLGDNQPNESPEGQNIDTTVKKGSSRAKRKRVDVTEDNEKKLRALMLSEEPNRPEGKTSTVGMSSILTRKRERADDDNPSMKTATEDMKLQKVVFVENLPLNASRKAITKEFSQFGAIESMHLQSVVFQDEKTNKRMKSIEEANKLANCQSARIVFKDERFARAAIAHNMKEFNGNRLRVTAAHAAVVKEEVSAPVDESCSIFVSNTPTNVKDEELFDLFSVTGSLKLNVTAVRVIRDPHTGLSKGTAYVFFKTQADVNLLLSSRHTLKLRGRVLRISRALANMQAEQKSKEPRPSTRSSNPETDDSISQKKRVKLSSFNGGDTAAKEPRQEAEQMLTRSRRGDTVSGKRHPDVLVSSSHVYATRQVAASLGPPENLEESPEAKRKRNEKRQRGISRSKKIRRT